MPKPKLPTMDELHKHLGNSPFVQCLIDELNKAQTMELSGKVVYDAIMNQPMDPKDLNGFPVFAPKEHK